LTGDENRAPRGGSRGDVHRANRDDDDCPSRCRGVGACGGDPGDPDDARDPGDHRDHGDRGDRHHGRRRGVRDVRQDYSGRHKRDESWSSRRHDSDDGDSSAFLPVGRGNNPSVFRPVAVNNAAGGNEYDAAKMCGGVKLDVYDGST